MDEKKMSLEEMIFQSVQSEEESSAKMVSEYSDAVGPWSEYDEIENVSLKDILDLVEGYNWYRKGFSLQVADNLYLYNSKAIIVKAKDKSLIVLPEAEVVLDLFHNNKEDFVGYDKRADHYVDGILKAIGREGYVFLSLNDALAINATFLSRKEFPVKYFIKDSVVAQGTSLFGHSYWSTLMNQICNGAHNWAPCMTYLDALGKLKNQLLGFDVICYECLAYIKDEKDYCIETKAPFDESNKNLDIDGHKRVAIFACYDPRDPQASMLSGESALKYLGMYTFDKARSEKEKHVAFKRYDNDKFYIK